MQALGRGALRAPLGRTAGWGLGRPGALGGFTGRGLADGPKSDENPFEATRKMGEQLEAKLKEKMGEHQTLVETIMQDTKNKVEAQLGHEVPNPFEAMELLRKVKSENEELRRDVDRLEEKLCELDVRLDEVRERVLDAEDLH